MCALAATQAAGAEPALGPNLVENPGFEDVEGHRPVAWYLPAPVYELDGAIARSGGRSLRFANQDPGRYLMCSQSLDLRPGAIYELKAWVRTAGIQGQDSGATVCIEWQDAGGNYLGGFYPPGRKGDTAGWDEVGGVSGEVPAGAARAHVLCYVRKGMTGTAWWDDVSVRRVHRSPLRVFLTLPAYRGWILDGQPSRVEARADLLWQELDRGAGPHALTGTLRPMGAAEAVARAAVEDVRGDHATIAMDLPGLSPGRYELETCLVDRSAGQTLASDLLPIERRAGPPPHCYVDWHGRLILGGEPFFPLGMYWGAVNEDELRIYADGPFNCLMPYALPSREHLDLAGKLGLKVIYSIKDFYHGSQWCPDFIKSEADEEGAVRRYVRQFRDHPALLAWYINDELPLSFLSRLVAHRDWVQQEDPNHPAWVVLFQVDDVAAYVDSFDVIGTDPYPIPDQPASLAGEWTRKTRQAVAGARAVWMVPQVFNKTVYDGPAEGRRPPTFGEMRSMAWQCVVEGANGLVFYSWFDIRRDAAHPFDQQWAKVKRVAEEVYRMSPVILSVDPVPDVRVDAPPWVRWMGRSRQGTLHLFVVNAGDKPAVATARFPRSPLGAADAAGQALALGEDGSLALNLEPLGVAICTARLAPPGG